MAGHEDNKDKFDGATAEPSKLRSFDVVTPVALSADGEGAVVFATDTNDKDESTWGFEPSTAYDVESYTGANSVSLAQLSPDGMVDYRAAAVANALSALPQDVSMDLIAEGREIVMVDGDNGPAELSDDQVRLRDVVDAYDARRIDLDLVDYMLDEGDIASVLKESLNAGEASGLDSKAINGALQGVETARILPEHANTLVASLEDPKITSAYGVSPQQANEALAVLSGDGPPAFDAGSPAIGQTLDITPPQ